MRAGSREEAEAKLKEAETLLNVSRAISGTLDVTEAMRLIARETAKALGADMVGAYLADADGRHLRPIAGYRVPKRLLGVFTAFAVPLSGHRILEEAWEKLRPVWSSDVENDPRVDPESVKRFPHRSSLFAPVAVEGMPAGAFFAVWWTARREFTPDEIRLVEGISSQAAIALRHLRLVAGEQAARAEAERSVETLRAVEEERARLSSAIEQSGEQVLIATVKGTIVYVNPAFEQVTGYSVGEALGQNPRILKSGRQDRSFYERMWQTILSGRVWRGELVNRRKDGALYTAEYTVAPVRDGQGKITHFVAIGEDVTGRKELEAQLRQAQKMEAVGRLAGGVAHDFNNLLTVIAGRAQLLLNRLDQGSTLRRDAELIVKAGERAASLTRQLLTFSRRQVLQPKVLDLNAIVANVGTMLERLIGEDIHLETVPGPALGLIEADPAQVEQVIMNLAVNARDAMPEGGRLTIETANVELDETADGVSPGRYVLLAVRDTGFGMDAETQARVFEPFFTTKEPGKGTGLGLATVYGIVQQSGGQIRVSSEPGRGTTFRIYLPRAKDARETVEPGGASAEAGGGSETILLAEDEEAVRDFAREILKGYGYTVLEARDGREAIVIAERHPGRIDLLLTDVVMPKMRGTDLAKQLVSLSPGTKVLYMSGYSGEHVGRDELTAVASAFLQKPFAPETLALRVREILDAPPTKPGR